MCRYWGSELRRKRRGEVKRGGPQKGWAQQYVIDVCRIDGVRKKYLLGEDVWIANDGKDDGWFMDLEEGVCNPDFADLDAEMILLQRPGLVEFEEGIFHRDKGI